MSEEREMSEKAMDVAHTLADIMEASAELRKRTGVYLGGGKPVVYVESGAVDLFMELTGYMDGREEVDACTSCGLGGSHVDTSKQMSGHFDGHHVIKSSS